MIEPMKTADDLVGRTIIGVRRLDAGEVEDLGWFEDPAVTLVLLLDDGALVWPQRDPEGNGPGVLTTCCGPLLTEKESF